MQHVKPQPIKFVKTKPKPIPAKPRAKRDKVRSKPETPTKEE